MLHGQMRSKDNLPCFFSYMHDSTALLTVHAPFIEWTDDMRFYVLFNSISVISVWWVCNDERVCAMGTRCKDFRIKRGPNSGLLDQQASP